ncbi:hypothetical protein AAII07_52265 [Microvirga sp. 0TCS3.31]
MRLLLGLATAAFLAAPTSPVFAQANQNAHLLSLDPLNLTNAHSNENTGNGGNNVFACELNEPEPCEGNEAVTVRSNDMADIFVLGGTISRSDSGRQ